MPSAAAETGRPRGAGPTPMKFEPERPRFIAKAALGVVPLLAARAAGARAAATAAIGVATAELYPDITLGATLTQGANGLDSIFSNSTRGSDLFAGLTAPIFHGGTLKANRRAAIDRARAADATYRQTVLDAFRQVADLLQSIENDAQSVSDQREASAVASQSLRLSRRSFEVGNTGILQTLDSARLYQTAQSNLVQARARQMLNVARLYVATAGGWVGSPDERAERTDR